MATRRLEIDLIVDDALASRGLGRVGRNVGVLEQRFGRFGLIASRSLGAASAAAHRLGSAARTASPYLIGGLALGLHKSVEEAREANKTLAQSEAVIDSTGGVANVTAKQIERLSERKSEMAAVDDELIAQGANTLLTFKEIRNEVGAGNDIFNQAVDASLDLSAAFDKDLRPTTIMVGKALNDPILGMTALSRVGIQFTEQQKEQITTLVESGKQLKAQKLILEEFESQAGGSAKAQADDFDRLGVVMNNFAEDVGMKVTPILADVAEHVSDIVSDKSLTGEQKTDALVEYFGELAERGIDELADHADEFAAAGGRIGLKVVGGLVEGFAESDLLGKLFIGGSVIRMLGGPGAITRSGRALGSFIGVGMAQGAAASAAGSGAASAAGAGGGLIGTVRGKVLPIAKRAGLVGVGIALADSVFSEFNAEATERGPELLEALDEIGSDSIFEKLGRLPKTVIDPLGEDEFDLPASSEAAKELAARIREIQETGETLSFDELQELRVLMGQIDEVSEEAKDSFKDFLQAASKKATWEEVTHNAKITVNELEFGWSKGMRKMAGISENELDRIQRLLTEKPRKGVRELEKSMDQGVRAIEKAMDSGEISTRKGLDLINELMLKRLSLYGIEGPDASKILKATNRDGSTNPGGLARGGVADIPGVGNRDTVPFFANGAFSAMVAPGEKAIIANKHQAPLLDAAVAEKYGVNGLPGFFSKFNTPHHMAGGGIVPVPGFPGEMAATSILDEIKWVTSKWPGLILTDAYGQGHSSAGHTETGTAADFSGPDDQMDAAVRALVGQGYLVGYDGRFGSEAWPGHGPSTVTPNFHLHVEFGSGGATLKGPGGMKIKLPRFDSTVPMFAPAAAGLNQVSAGMEKELRMRLASMPDAGGVGGASGATLSQPELKGVWRRANPGEGNPHLMSAIAMAESHGVTNAIGHDPGGTLGLGPWQVTTGYNDDLIAKYGGRDAMLSPTGIPNAKAAGDLLDRQGLGAWVVYNTGAHQQFMAEGGILKKLMAQVPPYIGSYDGGGSVPGPVGKPYLATVHGGEEIIDVPGLQGLPKKLERLRDKLRDGELSAKRERQIQKQIEQTQEQLQVMRDLRAEIREANQLAKRGLAIGAAEMWGLLTDVVSEIQGSRAELIAQGPLGAAERA